MLIELPMMAIEGLEIEEGDGLLLINRIPGANDVQAAAGGHVILEIASATGSPPDIAETIVSIDGEVAFSAGAFLPGWDGADSATGIPDPDTLRIVIDPQVDFVSLSTVTVSVQSADLAAGAQLDEEYQFTIEDLLVPLLVSAEAPDLFTVRAMFNEPVSLEPPGDAADPGAWRVEPAEIPAISPAIIAAEPGSDPPASTIILTFAEELSPNRRYRLIVENVADLFGNILIYDDVEFLAPGCPSAPGRRRFSMLEFLPDAVLALDDTGDQRVLISVWQEIFELVLCDIDRFQELVVDPETAMETFIDRMLIDMGNPFTFEELELLEKRRLLLALIDIYRLKGTAPGIIAAVRFFLGIDITLDIFNVDQWELGIDELGIGTILGASAFDEPLLYSFRVISDNVLTEKQRFRITRIVLYMKGIHEHFLGIVEPSTETIDHWELGLSGLGIDSILH